MAAPLQAPMTKTYPSKSGVRLVRARSVGDAERRTNQQSVAWKVGQAGRGKRRARHMMGANNQK